MAGPPEPLGAMQRRALLKKAAAAGAIFWAAPAIDSFRSVAAAASDTTTSTLWKTVNNNENVPLDIVCTVGGLGNSKRGDVVWTRTEGPAQICATITMTTGTSAVGREVYILQSLAGECVGGDQPGDFIRPWSSTDPLGPQTFCAPIVNGATTFVVALQLSGGGGVDSWSSVPITLG